MPHKDALTNHFLTRRELLHRCGMGLGALALRDVMAGAGFTDPLAERQPHFPGKAKRVVHFFMNGGPSHVDTFDPKPSLLKYAGKALPFTFQTERKTGAAYPSAFEFPRRGKSGIEISEVFPQVGSMADDLCVIRSMHTEIPNHEPSLMMMNCGDIRQIRPSFGAWVTYGLGSENQNLPGFVVLCPNGLPIEGSRNWRSAFLPGAYQGTYVDTKERAVEKLIDHIRNYSVTSDQQRKQIDLLNELNREYQEKRQSDALMESRIQAFELAYRMQMEATEAFDVEREPPQIREMYGDTLHGRQALIARRLLERGVRFVQVWHGAGQPWDNHDDIEMNVRRLAGECDTPIAAFLKDLKQRGMLDETLVIWGGEFGRTPTVELPDNGANSGKVNGRDHNSYGFSMWLAGGGLKQGYVHGATDEFGFAAVEKKVHVHDLHATLLHLLGFDHEKFTFRYAGRDFRLTDVHGHVVKDLLA